MPSFSVKARHRARILAMQALYQNHYCAKTSVVMSEQFKIGNRHQKVDWPFFDRLIEGVWPQLEALDHDIAPLVERDLAHAQPVEHMVIRLALFELKECLDVPYKVVLDEYIEVAKEFGANEGHQFVNGILDKLAHQYRKAELSKA